MFSPIGTNILFFVVSNSDTISIREQPSLTGAIIRQLPYGDQIEIDTSNPTGQVEAEGWVWRSYQGNWVAERKIDNSAVNLLTIPRIHSLFDQSPVDITLMSHFYYYGNTLFAYCCGRDNNYDGYSQGLHGGLDYGHPGGLPIVAGVSGTYRSTTTQFFGPNCIRVETLDGYTILYGHVAAPTTAFQRGNPVTPNSPLAQVDSHRRHMHLEVRYLNETYIVNPLLLMPEAMSQALIAGFAANGAFSFYQDANWTRWQTPFDQPVIRRGKRLVGPTVGKATATLSNTPACAGMNCG